MKERTMTQTVSGETSYFSSLRPRLETAPSPVRASVMEHLDYLADKAGKTSQELLSGARFTVHPQYEKDAKAHIEVLLGPFTLEDGDTAYFVALRDRLETAPSPVHASVMEHLDYLADKAGKTSQELLSGARFTVHPQYEKDAKAHIEVLLGPFTLEDGDTAYFVALRDRLQAASAGTRAGVMIHLDYLADKAGKTSQELLSGARFVTRAQTERDVKHCINEVFQWTSGDAGVASAPHIGQAPRAALDRPIIDQLSWDRDEIEKRAKMLGSYTRIDPEII